MEQRDSAAVFSFVAVVVIFWPKNSRNKNSAKKILESKGKEKKLYILEEKFHLRSFKLL